MATLRAHVNSSKIVFPDSYPSVDMANVLSTSTSYTATKTCYAVCRGAVSVNSKAINSNMDHGVCVLLQKGDKITAGTAMRVFGVRYVGGV